MSIESVMPSNHLILCHPLLLLDCIIPSNLNGVLESSPPQISFPYVMDDSLRLNNLQNAYLIQRLTLCISYVQLLSRV